MAGTGLRVVKMMSGDAAAYAAFVGAHPEAMLYHSLPYVQMISALTGGESETLLAVDESRVILGALPLLAKDGPLGRVLNSLPYYGSNGGVLAATPEAARMLLEAYDTRVTAEGVCAGTVVGNPLAATPGPNPRHSVTDRRIGQFTPIAFAERHAEQLMDAYHSKVRNMVRKAEKCGIRVSEENGMVEFLMEVHQENMRAIGGQAKSPQFFQLFPRHFQASNEYKILVARLDGEPVAALLLFYFRDTVEYFTPVICAAHRDQQPLSLLIHHGMTEASARGYRRWNWGGTWPSQDGVHLFKKRWGTMDIDYTYYVQVNNPAVFEATRDALLEQYPGFFVVPFQMLATPA